MKRRIVVRGVIVREGKILCVRHISHENEPKKFWCTPGGGLNDGESLIDGVTRELIEETGIRPIVGRLLFVQQFHYTNPHPSPDYDHSEGLEFLFHIENADDYLAIDLDGTSHGTLEIAEWAFVDPRTATILPDFLATDMTALIDSRAPVHITSSL